MLTSVLKLRSHFDHRIKHLWHHVELRRLTRDRNTETTCYSMRVSGVWTRRLQSVSTNISDDPPQKLTPSSSSRLLPHMTTASDWLSCWVFRWRPGVRERESWICFLPQVSPQSEWRKRSRRRRCYEEARRRMRRKPSNMADSRERRGRARLQLPVVSSVRNGSGDSYTESSERDTQVRPQHVMSDWHHLWHHLWHHSLV